MRVTAFERTGDRALPRAREVRDRFDWTREPRFGHAAVVKTPRGVCRGDVEAMKGGEPFMRRFTAKG